METLKVSEARKSLDSLVDENGPRCIEGTEFLADNPYETAVAFPGT